MTSVVPHPFLFRYSLVARKVSGLPRRSRTGLVGLPPECALPHLGELDGLDPIGEIRVAWNDRGLGVSVEVTGRTCPVSCDPANPTTSDGLQVWVDTRDTRNIHRASRFCHHFCFLPATKTGAPGGGVGIQLPIARARDEVTPAKTSDLPLTVRKQGAHNYRLDAWLSADVLTGFDADANSRLGFYYYLRDSELGDQFLSVGTDFPFAHDPSLWSTLELID